MSEDRTLNLLYLLIRIALYKKIGDINEALAEDYNQVYWDNVYSIAKSQGVSAIALDAISIIYEYKPDVDLKISKSLKLRWIALARSVECTYANQLNLSSELADFLDAENIKTYVFKGIALSTYYPRPNHRECGDLDCYLGGLYEKGNQLLLKSGYNVDDSYYVHSHINYKGLVVENHQFTQPVRGSQLYKKFDSYIRELIQSESGSYIGNTKLIKPSSNFSALHLTSHGLRHFLSEGIKLRHILDWALLLKSEQNNINWTEFYKWSDKMHMTRFADALTAISVKHLGLIITNSEIHQQSDFADKVLDDILNSNHSIHNTGASKFRKRLMIIRNKLFGGWKYRELYEKSAIIDTMQMVLAFFIERKPKI